MPERLRLVDLVNARLEQFLDERTTQLGTIADDLAVFTDARDLFQQIKGASHIPLVRPHDCAEVGGGLGAFVGLPAQIPADLPEAIVIDITKLRIGQSIRVKDLENDGLSISEAKNAVVVAVKMARGASKAAEGDDEDED